MSHGCGIWSGHWRGRGDGICNLVVQDEFDARTLFKKGADILVAIDALALDDIVGANLFQVGLPKVVGQLLLPSLCIRVAKEDAKDAVRRLFQALEAVVGPVGLLFLALGQGGVVSLFIPLCPSRLARRLDDYILDAVTRLAGQ